MTGNLSPPLLRRPNPARNVRSAKFLPGRPAFLKRKRSRGKYAVGIRYERQAQDHLALLALGRLNLEYRESAWIEFSDQSGRRWCQVDGLMIDRERKVVIIYEIKYQHCADAWWQLTYLYEPVIRHLFPGFRVARMEIVNWHDPTVDFPEKYTLTESPLRVPKANEIAVHIFNPRRRRNLSRVPNQGRDGRQGAGQAPGRGGLQEGANGHAGASGLHSRGLVQQGGGEVPSGAEGSTAKAGSRNLNDRLAAE